MHYVIREILDSGTDNVRKAEEIAEIEKSIGIAKRIFSGEFTYCKSCGDYFLSRSFFQESEIVEERICTYSDPINSGGDEYKDGKVEYTYMYCPKGCKHKIRRKEI